MDELLLRAQKALRRYQGNKVNAEATNSNIVITTASRKTLEVYSEISNGQLTFYCVVVGAAKIRNIFHQDGIADLIWRRNRELRLVRFLLDDRGRLSIKITLPEKVSDAILAWGLVLLANEAARLGFVLMGPQKEVG